MTRRWRLRERASDAGARDRLAAVFTRVRRPGDAGRDRAAGDRHLRAVDGEEDGRQPGRLDRPRGERRGADGSREASMVPRADFRSYYGRPVLKTPVWKDDIAYYFFLGGLSAGSSMLAAGADLTGRPALRRGTRIASLGSLALGSFYLVHDLGRPERFHHMLRVAKPTSPMSVGTWILVGYGPGIGLAAASELMPRRLRATRLGRLLGALARPGNLASAALAPAVASYTAALLSQTAVPAWNEAHEELPFVFTASAAASAGGLGMIVAPLAEAGPARRLAAYGSVVELAASRRMEGRLGLVAEAFATGKAHRYLRLATGLTAAGGLGAMLLARHSRLAAAASGAALLAGSFYERLGILHAGVQSTEDPKYVVEPQRRRIEESGPTRVDG